MIEGKLVRLRSLRTDDLERVWTWINDREVTRHLAARYEISKLAEEEWLRRHAAQPLTYNHVQFAIETKDGAHIGGIDFHIVIPENRKARMGIMIGDKAYWSKGYGTDAIVTLLRFGFGEMNLNRVDLSVDDENARAIACYEKVGFVHEGRLRQARFARGVYRDQLVMGILRDEFYARHAAVASA